MTLLGLELPIGSHLSPWGFSTIVRVSKAAIERGKVEREAQPDLRRVYSQRGDILSPMMWVASRGRWPLLPSRMEMGRGDFCIPLGKLSLVLSRRLMYTDLFREAGQGAQPL